jgi:hypothetical protein
MDGHTKLKCHVLEADAVDEASALERHVRGAHDERLAGRRRHREHVVRRDAVLLAPRNVEILRAATTALRAGAAQNPGL